MEVRYGVLIERATEQEEIINNASTRTNIPSYLSQTPNAERRNTMHYGREISEEETIHRSRVGGKLCDSDVSSDSDSEPEITLTLPPDSRYRPSTPQ